MQNKNLKRLHATYFHLCNIFEMAVLEIEIVVAGSYDRGR